MVNAATTTTSLLLLLVLVLQATGGCSQSCYGRCGADDGVSACQCNSLCSSNGNCCSDYEEICLSCQDRCGELYLPSKPCQCNRECSDNANCCDDYTHCLSCQDRCGELYLPSKPCQCNRECTDHANCCGDFSLCLSCQDRCGEGYMSSKPCQCNDECGDHGNCCGDYDQLCSGGGATDAELRDITEEMFNADVNSVGNQLTLDHQGQGTTGDLAPGPLFTSVPESALSGPTISALVQLLDNYIPSVTQPEQQDETEVVEQEAFLDAVTNTQVMQLAETFLQSKNLLTGSLRDKLNEIWFTMYPRRDNGLSSSGFEHVFVGELKDGKVSGFHSWVNFQKEESEGDLDYQGWERILDLGDKGEILKHHFEWHSEPKHVGSMFVGTSPELSMATYTVCFLARRREVCPVQMNNQQFDVRTWDVDGLNLVGSAYPAI